MAPTAGKVITCKAAVCYAPGEPLIIEEIQVDPPQPGEIRVKILYVALCHSDIIYWKDTPGVGLFPRIFGHEAAGVVESVGEGVTTHKEGDHVLPLFFGECKECRHCKSQKSNMCSKFRVDANRGVMLSDQKSRFSLNGKTIYHFLGSTFSEYTLLDASNVVKINPEAPLEKVCILSCGVTTGICSAWNVAKVEKGSTVAVFGLGTIGLAVAEGCRTSGVSRIIGVDINPDKAEIARTFGVTEFVNPKDHDKPLHEVINKMTDGGADYVFECIGKAKMMETAVLCTRDGFGTTVIVGVAGESTPMELHPGLYLHGRTLTGAILGGVKASYVPEMVEKYLRKEFQLDEFITHHLPFSQINESFKLMLEGKGLRCVMNY